MALRKILTASEDLNFLHETSKIVEEFDSKLFNLLDDLIETLNATDGAVGLAAVQIGILKRVAVIKIENRVFELINPAIIETEGEQNGEEGCLSFPNQFKKVKRPNIVKVKSCDRDGKFCFFEGSGLLARAFCHEIDHMDGIVFLDRV